MNPSGNTILMTGGGSGIGRALAHRFHDAGNRVIVAGRRREPLEETAAGREGITVATLDVEDAGAIADFAERVIADHPALNILFNNAGIMRQEDATGARDLADAEATVTTNIFGPVRLIDALVDHLATKPDAAIVNVTSGLAFVPLANFPTYSASKAFIHSYTVALREKLEGRVELIELSPPGVRTELTPGQSEFDAYMSLDAFADETMARFGEQPTPPEIAVQRAQLLRNAERDGQFAERFKMVNAARSG